MIGLLFTQTLALGDGTPGREVDPQGGTVDITTNLQGGPGNQGSTGAASTGTAPAQQGGTGDTGGSALVWQSPGTVNNTATLTGGTGGKGGTGGGTAFRWETGGQGGTGGTGGFGAVIPAGGILNNKVGGRIIGGQAGGSGEGGKTTGLDGSDGAPGKVGEKGSAVKIDGGTLNNEGEIIGASDTTTTTTGGSGVSMTGNGTLSNLSSGKIKGGSGVGGGGSTGVGVLVQGSGNQLMNAGEISGGTAGANAVTISGDNNTLELQAGHRFNGAVVASGANNQLTLGGSTDANFAMSSVNGSSSVFQGFSKFAKTGSSTWTLADGSTSVPTSSAPWSIQAGTLKLAATNILNDASVTVNNGATLDINGFNQILGDLSNAGNVRVGGSGTVGTTLFLNGSYTSNGGNLYLNTALGGDNSFTDKLIVGQVVLGPGGPTHVTITNQGGLGAQTTNNGIEIIEVRSANSAADAFVLNGKVEAGAYEYRLQQNGTNWYLSSVYRNSLPLILAIPALANQAGQAMLGSHQHRVTKDENSVWMRVLGEKGKVGQQEGSATAQAQSFSKYGPSYDTRLSGVQFGMDTYQAENADAGEVAGLYVGAAQIKGDVNAVYGGKAGTSKLDGYTIGGYWTQKDKEGYADWIVQATHYGKVRTQSGESDGLNTKGLGISVSIEEGKTLPFGTNWSLEPQAQLVYQHIRLKKAADSASQVQYGNMNVVSARLGTKLNKSWGETDRRYVRAWVGANMWRQFKPEAKSIITNLGGTTAETYKTDLGKTWGQVGMGVTGQLSKNVGVSASADYNHSLDAHKRHSVGGKLQLDVNW